MMAMPRFQDVGSRAARFGIDQIREFCDVIENPQKNFRSIHVAGTNGKGTVCSILASVYKAAGYTTALYTSPHLVDVRERFRINGVMIPPEELVLFFDLYDDQLKQYPLTFFELTTAIAFWWFSWKKVDIAIIETGLGGRLDATNIIDPLVSVITSIGLDHTEQLGNSIESIATEKAGILKPGRLYVTGDIDIRAMKVIQNVAKTVSSSFFTSGSKVNKLSMTEYVLETEDSSFSVRTDLGTPYLGTNIRVCLDAINAACPVLPVSMNAISQGLEHICANSGFGGRFQRLHAELDWYFDGGHNPQALQAVLRHVSEHFPGRNLTIVTSMMTDKFNAEIIDLFKSIDHIFYYEQESMRALRFIDFRAKIGGAHPIGPEKNKILETLKYLKTELVLFTGSFYFYSTVSEWMESLTHDSNCAETSPSTIIDHKET